MTRWEYRIVSSKDVEAAGILKGRTRESVEAYLNELGQEGWEMVNIDFVETTDWHDFVGLAKRPL